jgi:hypothetical protein
MHGGMTEVVITRKGRKRRSGYRTPSGDLARQKRPDDRLLAAMQPHRRQLPEKDRLSEKAVTVLGRLNLFGRITDEQAEAGRKYAAGVNAYRAVIGSMDPLMSPAPGFGKGMSDEEAIRRKEAYDAAFELLSQLGNRPIRAVNKAAVYENTAYGAIDDLRLGLNALVRHYGLLTASRKSDNAGNR